MDAQYLMGAPMLNAAYISLSLSLPRLGLPYHIIKPQLSLLVRTCVA